MIAKDSPGAAIPFAWSGLGAIVLLALLLRTVFFTGFFGSDELTYTQVALDIADGRWESADYIGALRYGINLPNAFFMKLFGASEFSANLWSLLCSVGEVALVYVFAYRLWGTRAALLCSIVIALLPMHVHFGGRLLADAPLAFFITLSFLLFWIGEQRQGAAWLFGAGLAAGGVFWIKEVAVIYWVVFAIYALAHRRWNIKWLWMGLGAMLMVGLNCVLLWAITGDPLHIFNVIRIVTDKYVHVYKVESSPLYYFGHLFVDIKHFWIMPYLALGGAAVWAAHTLRQRAGYKSTGYVVLWALGLFSVFSFTPISFAPLTLIAKQSNYMLIFAAPFCMLAGYALARLSGLWLAAVLSVLVGGSVLLAALQQQVIHAFTANSKATVAFAQVHAGLPVYGMTNAFRAASYQRLFAARDSVAPIRSLSRLDDDLDDLQRAPTDAAGFVAYAVLDVATMGWSRSSEIRHVDDRPKCWVPVAQLEPTGFGQGRKIVAAFVGLARWAPATFGSPIRARMNALYRPAPAYGYGIPLGCTDLPVSTAR